MDDAAADELECRQITAPGNVRVDVLLVESIPDVSRALVQKWIAAGVVQVDGELARAGARPRAGQIVTVTPPPLRPLTLEAEPIPLRIVYEDSDLLVVDKCAGMVVHPGAGVHSGTLVNALVFYIGELSSAGGSDRPGIVHRLDKDTSGLLLVARNDFAHRELALQIATRTAGRRYIAIVWGNPPWDHATIQAPIGRDPTHRTRMAVVPEDEGGRPAETLIDVEERMPLACVVRATLRTGRTHQIRAHCAYAGFPIVADPVYGDARRRVQTIRDPAIRDRLSVIHRQALHACDLSFTHPRTGEALTFHSDPPPDWQEILELMRKA